MRQMFTRLITLHPRFDQDVRRRGRMLIILALALSLLSLLLLPTTTQAEQPGAAITAVLLSFVFYIAAIVLARRGLVTLGGVLLIVQISLAIILSGGQSIQSFNALYFLILPIQVASLVLRPVHIWFVLVFVVIGVIAKAFLAPSQPLSDPAGFGIVFSVVLLLALVALVGFLSGQATTRALAEANSIRFAVETTAGKLADANAALEQRVNQRTAELQQALVEVESRATEQAHLLQENQQQRDAIRNLSVPVLPVGESTLVMPLVGTLDSTRLELTQDLALDAIGRAHARHLVLDITGVPLVDSQVAQGLVSVVQSARLLGSEVVLVGVRPEVAQAIVGLGIDLRGVRTFSDLRSAINGVTKAE